MKYPLSLDQVLFDVSSAPVEAVIGSNGFTRRLHIPGKKACAPKTSRLEVPRNLAVSMIEL
jgi:hypothetical protein